MSAGSIKPVHEGRSGHIELDGFRYAIEHIDGGRFAIAFPCGNRHRHLQAHLNALQAFANSQNPPWFLENKSSLVPGQE